MQLTYFWSRKKGIGAYTGISLYNIFQSHEENAPGYFYSSLSTWNNFTFHIDPDTTDSWTSSTRYDGHVELSDYIYSSIGIPIGINYRILPNIWITAGVDFIINFTAWSEGTIQYKNPNGKIYDYPSTYWFEDFAPDNFFDFGLQAGINAITNFLDFNICVTYVLPDKFYFDVGAGFVL